MELRPFAVACLIASEKLSARGGIYARSERLDYAQEAVRRFPGRFAIMARVALNDPTAARRFSALKEQLGVLGIRLAFLEK